MTETSTEITTGQRAERLVLKKNRRGAASRISADVTSWPRISRHYAWLMVGGIIAIIFYYGVLNPNHKQPLTLLIASLVFILSCLPMIRFLFLGRVHQVPVVEAHGLFYAVAFGLAGFLPIPQASAALTVDETDMVRALRFVLMGLVALLLGYYVVGPQLWRRTRPLHPGQGISNSNIEWLAWSGCATGLMADWAGSYSSIGSLSQIGKMFFTLGFFSLFVLTLEKKASSVTRIAVVLLLLPLALLMRSGLSSGQLAGIVTLICWISLVMLRAWRRIPILLLTGAFVFFIVLNPVKSYVRNLAWNEGVQLNPWQTLQVYAEGFTQTYGSASALIANRSDALQSSFDRINHLATTAAIIRDTPSTQPYLWGRSYLPLLTKWIPRGLWAGKPEERFGNDWTRRYGFLSENDLTTSFNLPWFPEMYMNFGWVGVVGIMFLLGLLYRLLWVWMMEQPETPAEYAVAIVFAQSLVFAESNFSLMMGGPIIFAVFLGFLGRLLQFIGIYTTPVIRNRKKPSSPHLEENSALETRS